MFIRYVSRHNLNIDVILTLASVHSSVIKHPYFTGQVAHPMILCSFSSCSVYSAGHWHYHDLEVVIEEQLLFKGRGRDGEKFF